jgi:two-component system KDP operon response regulator KdpE
VLTSADYRVFEVATAREAILQASCRNPDLVLLDLGLPDRDGLAVVRKLREWMRAPILVVSAREREQDKIEALDAGADDYLTKPFATGELLARMRVAIRRAATVFDRPSTVFESGDLRVDLERRQCFVRGAETALTPIEWKLLAALIRHRGRVALGTQLLREVWGPGDVERTHYLRIYVASLRRKLEREPAKPQHLITEPGVGYRLREDE